MEAKPEERDHKRLAELTKPLVEYLNRFFVIALNKKPEIVQLEYDQEGKHIVNFVRRSVRSHWDTYTHRFMQTVWYKHDDRREVDRLTFELDPAAVGPREFNMFLGLKAECDSNNQQNHHGLYGLCGDGDARDLCGDGVVRSLCGTVDAPGLCGIVDARQDPRHVAPEEKLHPSWNCCTTSGPMVTVPSMNTS